MGSKYASINQCDCLRNLLENVVQRINYKISNIVNLSLFEVSEKKAPWPVKWKGKM